MVHHLQNMGGVRHACPQERERTAVEEAYPPAIEDPAFRTDEPVPMIPVPDTGDVAMTVTGNLAEVHRSGVDAEARFHARDLNLVMAPGTKGKPVRFRVLIDGNPPGAAHGVDVDERGNGMVAQPRMYQLIRQPGPIAEHQFEIQFLDPGVEVFVFTFG
jgi:hypothetical protein